MSFDRFVDAAAPWLALLRSFRAVLAATEAERAFFEAGGVCPSRLRRPGMFAKPLPTPTPAEIRELRDRLGVGSGFLIVTAAAEFSEPKGSRALMRAAAVLPHMTFAFLGGTPRTRAWLEQCVPRSPNVHLLGFVDEREKAIALAAADLFALPSRADSFGIAYQEAHSLGTPSLALDLPVMREVIGPAGIFVDPGTGDEGVARALAELVRRPDRLRLAAKASVDVAARYAPARVLPAICDLVEEVAAQRREPERREALEPADVSAS
jgi:glycosyltransferase involved in cell wall biosynthesis